METGKACERAHRPFPLNKHKASAQNGSKPSLCPVYFFRYVEGDWVVKRLNTEEK